MSHIGQFGEDSSRSAYLALAALVAARLLYGKAYRNQVIYYVKFTFYHSMAFIVTTAYIPLFLLRPKDVRNFQLMSVPTKITGLIIGLDYKLKGMQQLEDIDGAVVVCNHQSTLDVIGMMYLWGLLKKCALVAKRELFFIWPFGISLWLAGVAFINRKSPQSSYETLEKTSRLIKEEKTKMWIFPEGTRNLEVNSTGSLLQFKKGAFRIAVACQVPIIPIVYSPYTFVSNNYFGRGTVTIEALPAISTKGLIEDDIDDLMDKTRSLMQAKYIEMSQIQNTDRKIA